MDAPREDLSVVAERYWSSHRPEKGASSTRCPGRTGIESARCGETAARRQPRLGAGRLKKLRRRAASKPDARPFASPTWWRMAARRWTPTLDGLSVCRYAVVQP